MATKKEFSFHKYLIVQMSAFVIAVSIITVTYLSAYISQQQSEYASQQLKHEAIVVANNLATATGSSIITNDYTTIEGVLVRTAEFDDILSMQILDPKGNTLSNVEKNKNNKIVPMFNKLSFSIPSTQELAIKKYDDRMIIYHPIALGDIIGWVRVVYSLEKIKQIKADIWTNNLESGFVITIIMTGILIYLLRRPVLSIKKYTDFADNLTKHSGGTIDVDTRSIELSRLGSSLNSASEDLHDQHVKLQAMLGEMETIAAIAEHSPDIILSISADNSIKYINLTAKNTIKKLFKSENESDVQKLLPKGLDNILHQCLSENTALMNIESSAKKNTYLWKFTPLKSQRVVHCHGIDITEQKLIEEKLNYQSNYDLETNLPNKVLALDRLKQAIIRSRRLKSHVGVMLLGIDRFKSVSNTMGYHSGAKIIRAAAERFRSCIRPGDTLARFGDDVFLIILVDIKTAFDNKIVAEKIINAMSDEFEIENHKFHLGVNIGITSCPDDETDANALVKNSDIAMHKCHENGDPYQFYTSEFNEQALLKVEMEYQLRNALNNNELFLTYQPQIDITKNIITGAEALIRWNNDKLGFVPPDKFISMAEDTGQIIPIGEWVLRTACVEAKKWQDIFDFSIRVAVNVSVRQLINQDFPAIVRKVLEETGLPASSLELEITESLLVEDSDELIATIREIKDIGVTLALDDFGTGYSSLSYLKRFPFDILKIDRAFIKDVIDNAEDASLCKAIAAIASSLKLNVIGEGVETREQLNFLRGIGADMVQGYLYSKPLEITPFIEYVKTFHE